MRVTDEHVNEINVGYDQGRSFVEVLIGGDSEDGARVVHLTSEEARRLASLILFQAARLNRPRANWGVPTIDPVRRLSSGGRGLH
jgi:hypothetical protein